MPFWNIMKSSELKLVPFVCAMRSFPLHKQWNASRKQPQSINRPSMPDESIICSTQWHRTQSTEISFNRNAVFSVYKIQQKNDCECFFSGEKYHVQTVSGISNRLLIKMLFSSAWVGLFTLVTKSQPVTLMWLFKVKFDF